MTTLRLEECPAPGCHTLLPENDTRSQASHMNENHPEIIAERLEESGFKLIDGKWVDQLA